MILKNENLDPADSVVGQAICMPEIRQAGSGSDGVDTTCCDRRETIAH